MPADDRRVCAEEREPSRFAALRRHDVHFRVALVASAEREPFARQRRMRGHAQPRREPSRDAARGRHRPQIVLADEDDGVVVDCGKPVVALGVHEAATLRETTKCG